MIRKSKHRQAGLTLIEMMVAIVLGFFVVGAVVSLFLGSKTSYHVNENMSRLQENARFAMSFLSRDLRWTDYRGCVTDDRLDNALAGGNDSGLNKSDVVTIRYQSNDCANTQSIVSLAYSVAAGANGGPALFRSVNGATAVEIVEDIENLQILYGEDTDNDTIPNYYVDAGTVVDWTQAVAVRMTVTARTPDEQVSANGGRISRDFTSTVVLRNRVP